jgi:hypothetical protein
MSFMLVQAPPFRSQFIKEAKETVEEAKARYESIANDIVEVVYDESEPALFKGPSGKIRTTALIMSIMLHESNFRRDVDFGEGPLAKGDNGRSVCLMQLNLGNGRSGDWNKVQHRYAESMDSPSEVEKGWTAKEIIADRKKCIRAGLRGIHHSFRMTSTRPFLEWLNVYASGRVEMGGAASEKRMGLTLTWFTKHKPDFTDADVLNSRADHRGNDVL